MLKLRTVDWEPTQRVGIQLVVLIDIPHTEWKGIIYSYNNTYSSQLVPTLREA